MKNMKVKIIAILLTLVLIGIFLLFFNRRHIKFTMMMKQMTQINIINICPVE